MNGNCSIFLQNEFEQYDTCNASAGSGEFRYNGYCDSGIGLDEVRLTLTLNSQDLVNTVNFMNNRFFYLTSMYTIEFEVFNELITLILLCYNNNITVCLCACILVLLMLPECLGIQCHDHSLAVQCCVSMVGPSHINVT